MNESDQTRLKQFANDVLTNQTVFNFILKKFLDARSSDVQYLAAIKTAMDLFQDVWKELEGLRVKKEVLEKDKINVGL